MARPIDTPTVSAPEDDLRNREGTREQAINRRTVETLIRAALESAHAIHERLGEAGAATVEKNRFGDTALVCDVEAEKAVIEKLAESNLHIRLHSEEHGDLELGSGEPVYTAILDGLDGSKVYARAPGKGRYGTMLAVYSGADPTYSDYLAGGIYEHANKRLYVAGKGTGAHLISPSGSIPLSVSSVTDLNDSTRIIYDDAFEPNRRFAAILKPLHASCLNSSSMHYADLAAGAADLVLECTRKGNLEIAVAYAVIREAGGVMLTEDGTDLGRERFATYGQPLRRGGTDVHRSVVSAATRELAEQALNRLATARAAERDPHR